MGEKITVIVPIYNVEQYLSQCLDSILRQTYKNLEIILVDDGSLDHCSEMCDIYQKKDNRIKVIHKKNGGLSDARNTALDIATGDYVTFVDSDDFILPNYVETLYTALKSNEADIAQVKFTYYFDDNDPEKYGSEKGYCRVYSCKEAIYSQLINGEITASACAKLYKIALFESVRFPVGEIYEDLAVFCDLFLQASRVAYVNLVLYRYRVRKGSIMQQSFNRKQYVEVRWIERNMDMVLERYPDLEPEARARRVSSYFKTLYRILCSKDRTQYRVYQDEMVEKIRRDSKGLLGNRNIDNKLKIKIISLYLGRYGYYLAQKLYDNLQYIKAGHRYIA